MKQTGLYLETQELMEMRKLMEGDEIPEEAITDTLLANADEFEKKAVAVYQAADEIDYDLIALNAMIADLQARKKLLEERQSGMRGALLNAMLETGITQVGCPFFVISTKKKPQAMIIQNEELLPEKYVTLKVETKPDKNAITAALREGKEVPGAVLVDGGTNLQVRKRK